MKIVSLNVWGGARFKELVEFIKEHAATTDIFCFQEVFRTSTDKTRLEGQPSFQANLLEELEKILPKFVFDYTSLIDKWDFSGLADYNISFGQAMFYTKSLDVVDKGERLVGRDPKIPRGKTEGIARKLQYVDFKNGNKLFTVVNIHGLWTNGPKTDNPDRLKQSEIIINLLKEKPGEKIVCGDFNLHQGTQSVEMLEKSGLQNLITDYQIETTRNELYADRNKYNDNFADYVFVSQGVKIKKFQVPQVLVSDHLPMILEFSTESGV